jgi:hypothetical protein
VSLSPCGRRTVALMSESERILPNLVVIGAPKCATTSLHAYLSTHPEIFMSRQKELHFFLTTAPWGTWSRGIDWYVAQFEEGAGYPARGEASPGYSIDAYVEGAVEQMAAILPAARLVYMVREPIGRIQSNYTEELYGGRIPPNITLEQILCAGPEGEGLLGHYHCAFVYTSLYYRQLARYWRRFSPAQMHVMTMESLAGDPVAALQTLFRFLEVDDRFVPPNVEKRLNEQEEKRLRVVNLTSMLARAPRYASISSLFPEPAKRFYRWVISRKIKHEELIRISPESHEYLRSLLAPDQQCLFDATGIKFGEWRGLSAPAGEQAG